jgi:hypothetical protein
MKRVIITLIFAMFLISFASGEIIIQQPKEIYNLGDTVSIPVTIKASEDIMGSLNIQLLCNGNSINYKTGVPPLSYGEEYRTNIYIPLIKQEIGEMKGSCKIKTSIGNDITLTNEFKISDLIKINLETNQTTFNPGENVLLEGEAVKENGDVVNGFIEITLITEKDNETANTTKIESINNGYFSVNLSFPKDTKAGSQLVKLKAYEKTQETITNNGFFNFNVQIKQVPTNLEIIFEEKEVEPGTNVKVKAILHDQTGEKIDSKAIITIKNNMGEILTQAEKATDEFLEFPIKYNEPPAEWKIVAISNKIKGNSEFTIKEKESIEAGIINKTMIIKNTGNIPYNKTILVNIGNKTINLVLFLKVDETKKYKLSAPDGKYDIEISANGDIFRDSVSLTGDSISIKEAKGVIMNPLIWVFIIAILGFIAFIIFKKGYKKSFFGYIHKKKERQEDKEPEKDSVINPKNKAELSLSIKGEKQNVSLVCIKIKNLKELIRKRLRESDEEKNVKKTLQNIADDSEDKKAVTYFNNDCLFFILAPSKTKTFSNEKKAIEIAQKAEEILNEHNKLYKKKIEFGISLNYGTIIAKQEEVFKFMSLGTLITAAKKIASLSSKEILLGEKIKNRLGANVKTEKTQKGKVAVYKIKEIKDRDEHKYFIRNFLNRIEKD